MMTTGNSWSNSWSVENWYGRGSAKAVFPWLDYCANQEAVTIDELYANYAAATSAPMYTFDYGTRPLRGDLHRWILNLNDDPPEIGDITEDDVDKLLKV